MQSYFLTEFRYYLRSYWRKWSKPLTQGAIACLIALGTVTLWNTAEGRALDHWVLRNFFLIRGPRPPPPEVVMIAIDDETYARLSASTNFPLPRHFLASALERIDDASPRAIIIDANIPAQPNLEPDADTRIEAALRAGPTTIWTGQLRHELSELDPGSRDSAPVLPSDVRFQNAARMELPMTVGAEDDLVMFMSENTSLEATLYERVPIAKALFELGKYDVETPGPDDLINFYGPKGTLNRLPLYKLLSTDASAMREELRDKIVVIGYQSIARGRGPMNKDEFYVSTSEFPMFGLEIHGNIIGNLIDGSWIKRLRPNTDRTLLILGTLLAAGFGIRMKPSRGVPMVIAIAFIVVIVEYELFVTRPLWISGIGSFLAAVFLTVVAIPLYRIGSTERFRNKIKRMLGFDFEEE